MALTDLDRLRLAIADRHRIVLDEGVGIGDGQRDMFVTQLSPIVTSSERVTVDWQIQVVDDDYSIDYPLGIITFLTSVPVATQQVRCTYRWSAFSDDELDDLLTQKGSVSAAAITALEWVIADTDRWMRYFFGQEMVDRSAGVEALRRLMESIRASAGAPAGVVRADTPVWEEALEPFIEKEDPYA